MKSLLLIITLCTTSIFAQNYGISIHGRYGISTSNLRLIDPGIDSRRKYMDVRSIRDVGLYFNYQNRIWDKQKIYAFVGTDVSRSSHYQMVSEPEYRMHLDNIILKKSRIDINLGIKKRFTLKKDYLSLDIGAALVFRQFLNESKTYVADFYFNNEDWIEFSYSLTTYHGKWYENNLPKSYTGRFGKELSATLNFKLSQKSSLNFGLSYITRNTFFYDYRYTIHYYYNGANTPSYKFTSFGFIDGTKHGVNDNYLYLNIGYTYQLKKKEKN